MNRILHEELEKEKENASLFISKYYSLEKEMNETKKDLQEQEKTVCVLQQKLNENEELSAKQTEEYKNKIVDYDKRYKSLQDQNTLLFNQLNSTKKCDEYAWSEDICQSETNKQIRDLKNLISILHRDNDIYMSTSQLKEQEILRLKQTISLNETKITELTTQITESIKAKEEELKMKSELDRDHTMQLETQLQVYQESNQAIRKEKNELEKQLKETTAQVEHYKDQMKPLQASLSEKEGTIEALKKEIALKNEDIKKYQQRYTDYVTKYSNINIEEYQQMKEDVAVKEAQIQSMSKEIEEHKKQVC